MPVEDHPVHAITKQGSDARYGCCNREPFASGHYAKDGFDGPRQRWSWVPHKMSRDCRYDMSLRDPKCDGCKHRGSGEAYDKKVREEGK